MQIGDVVNMTHWTHFQPNIQASYRAPKGRVGVFLLLGDADKKSPESFDCVAAINNLGWFPKEDASPTQPQPIYDEESERSACRKAWAMRNKNSHFEPCPFPDYWAGWKDGAQSRAKSVEVGDE